MLSRRFCMMCKNKRVSMFYSGHIVNTKFPLQGYAQSLNTVNMGMQNNTLAISHFSTGSQLNSSTHMNEQLTHLTDDKIDYFQMS